DNIPAGANLDLISGVPSTLVQTADALSLAPGASATVTFKVTVTVAGAIDNVANTFSTENPDPAVGRVRDVALTRASLAGLRVSPGVIEFATSWQRGTAGFHLYASDSPKRRADRVQITGAMIKSPRPESMTPILYRVDATTVAPYLWIEEVELGSDSGRLMGPFAIDDASLLHRFEAIERRMAGQPSEDRRGSRSLRPPARQHGRALRGLRRGPARAGSDGVKIEIEQPGRIQVSWSDLIGAGLPARFSGEARRLQLTSRGAPVAYTSNPTGLSFLARDLATDYTANNVYVLTWNGAPTMKAPLLQSEPPLAPGFERVQKNWIYYQAAPKGTDPWLWDVLESGQPWPSPDWDPTLGDFDLPGYTAGSGNISVKIALLGRTEHAHHVEASINGAFVGSIDFTGVRTAVLEGTVSASALAAASNHLTLSYSASGAGDSGYVYLDYMDLGLTLPPGTGAVARISSFDGSLPRINRADYLIVTHPDFEAQAERIAALKNTAGRNAVVVDVERAYDRFTAGIPDASAVKALIALASRATTVLLIGDDTIDPADNYGQGERVYIPSALGFDPFTGRVASENLYADRNDDGAPDLAIGRLSVRTAEQADAMVMKVENEDALLRQNVGRHLVAVDNQGLNDMAFRAEGRTIESMLDGTTTFADISLGASTARDAVLAALGEGALTTTYVGHGAPDYWADEAIFRSDDAAALANTNQGTLLFTWACLSSDYRYFYGPAVSEAMVLTPMGGAVASFGPTGLSLPTLQREIFLRLYPKVMAGMSLGDAVREAKTEMLAAHPTEREFLHGWVLLGDPDVRLPR
ncbi:MAG: C25 family cysteine peptidase, partial [Vicinamibacteria bacterium]